MNFRLFKRLLILAIWTILFACTNSETARDQNSSQESTKNEDGQISLSDKDPEETLAIIQEGTNPPSEQLVENFGELLSSLKGYYSDIATNEMADKLAMAYDLAAEKGNEESLLEFVIGFKNGVQNSINSNLRLDFTQFVANYICYKTNCDGVNSEVLKFFDPNYVVRDRSIEMSAAESLYREKIEAEKIEEKEIFGKLKKRAEKDWPSDYTTQEFWINEQIGAYRYMKTIPDDKIKRKAQRDWPLDFTTQKFWYNEQIAAKKRLENR